jgi:hypothetical protein
MTGSAAIRAGVAYGVIGFGFGFCFGAVRTMLVAPAVGAFVAVALETPLMLAACTPLALWCLRRWGIASSAASFAMGLAAFAALMVCEVLFGLALGQGPLAVVAAMARPEGLLGLAGQVTFALLPLGFVLAQRLPRQER